MKIADIIRVLETAAPLSLQEPYDNAGLQAGDPDAEATGALLCVDVTEEVLEEAIELGVNLIVAHHPLLFKGLKSVSNRDYTGRIVMRAIRRGIAIYASHTNLDSAPEGVNYKIADLLGLERVDVLQPAPGTLLKLTVFVPAGFAGKVRDALFAAGAGSFGNYSDCSFSVAGTGTFRPGEEARPFCGEAGELHRESEERIELLLPGEREKAVVDALLASHPYEVPAYDLVPVSNRYRAAAGLGVVGWLPAAVPEIDFLQMVRSRFEARVVRHSTLSGRPVRKIAVCGGSGGSLLPAVRHSGADVFVTGELKYHDFFEAADGLLLADFGHYETEACTKAIFCEIIRKKFPTFALHYTKAGANPINYL